MIRRQAEVGGGQLVALDLTVAELRDHRRRVQRYFIHTAAMYHGSSLVAQHAQGFRNRQHQFRTVDANQRQRRMRRVDQRPEHVEQGTGFELLAYRHRVTEAGVVFRRKQEANAQFIQRLARFIGIHIEIDTECCQQVGRTGLARHAAVAVFGDLQAAGGSHKRAGG